MKDEPSAMCHDELDGDEGVMASFVDEVDWRRRLLFRVEGTCKVRRGKRTRPLVSTSMSQATKKEREYELKRPPEPHEKAGRIIFAHDAGLADQFDVLLGELERLDHDSLQGPGRGREGMLIAVKVVLELLDRLPLEPRHQSILAKPLEHLVEGLEAIAGGSQFPAFQPAASRPGRREEWLYPGSFSLRGRFKDRCVLLHVALVGKGDSIGSAAHAVWMAGKKSAAHLGISGFSATTIRNWRRRHDTAYNKWLQEGADWADDTPASIRAREGIELLISLVKGKGLPPVSVRTPRTPSGRKSATRKKVVRGATPRDQIVAVTKIFKESLLVSRIDRSLYMYRCTL